MRPAALCLALAAAPALAQEVPPVPIRIEFDAAATEALTASGHEVTVSAWFYGPPADKFIPTDQMGLATLRTEVFAIEPVTQVVELGQRMGEVTMGWTRKPYLNVNVYEALEGEVRRGDPWLDCGLIDDALGHVRQGANVISCVLAED